MQLKTKLVVAITLLVFAVVVIFSWLYFSQLLGQNIEQSYNATDIVAHQLQFATRQAIENGTRNVQIDVNNQQQLRDAVAKALRQDDGLRALLNSVISYSPTVLNVSIVDWNGLAYLSTNPMQQDQTVSSYPDYASLRRRSVIQTLKIVFGPPRDYSVSLGLERNNQPLAVVRITVRTTFLSNILRPQLEETGTLAGVAVLITLIVSAFVANLALKPIESISRQLDAYTSQAAEEAGAPELAEGESRDAVVQVSHKIERLGRRMRNVEEVFSALKENLDQILSNLQDGMMLFTRDSRAVLVSSSVERFLHVDRDLILGADVSEIFDRTSILGRVVREAFDRGISLVQEEITMETGRRVEVSLDFIHDDRAPQGLGALLTLHDLESVQEIESELELSRRMAAIGQLTSGVGHEVKNPINAIVVHLELLRNKISDTSSAAATRHLDVIQSEIERLDRVVQTLVDFSRPVELQLHDQDLRAIVNAVLGLASAELATRDVRVMNLMPDYPMIAKVDADLVRQALLNIVLNGAQAMTKNGGVLEVRLREEARHAILSITDEGEGIPEEILPKIFNLYFTTKKGGSGIGLAMTYRIVQLHNGQLDVESTVGKGTTFILRIPIVSPSPEAKLRGHLEAGAELSKAATKEPWL